MLRTTVSGLTVAALLAAAAGGQALSQTDGRDFLVWQKSSGSPPILPKKPKEIVVVGSKAANQRSKALSGQQRKQRLFPSAGCPQCSIKKK